jgi:signal transduction histidine kinase
MKTSISARMAFFAVAMHAIVLPALYYGFNIVVTRSDTDVFVQHVRTLSRNIAEELELGDALGSPQRVANLLDQAVINGDGVFAALVDNGQEIRSELNMPSVRWVGRQDFTFRHERDQIYFIALPISRPGHTAELRLGFDERPTVEQIQSAMRRALWVLVIYLCVSLTAAVAWSHSLSRPVVQLQRTSRKIARGDYAQSLRVKTDILELHDLGSDLEYMRNELVGVNERLKTEMSEKVRAQEHRNELERRLRHRQRLETVGTLAGGIAHEFNNVLLPIVLFSEAALAESPEHTSVHGDLQEILAQAYRAKEVVEKLLTFSRGADAPKLELIDLEPIVAEALRLFRALMPATIEIHVELAGPYPPVRADAAMTIQMIMNLCTNAYQALRNRTGVITVGLQYALEPVTDEIGAPSNAFVVLFVTDSGHGIEPGTVPRIFEPFFTTRDVGEGTGLGLSVVHGIAESFGATVSVETEVGHGATFRVHFPVASDAAAHGPSNEPTTGASA